MGSGKTTISQQLKKTLKNSVFLDGDWCWNANPPHITAETKKMVIENICYLLNQFIHCSSYEHIIFCWVMHEQAIIDSILSKLDTKDCQVIIISLIIDPSTLKKRLLNDIKNKLRDDDIISRSLTYLPKYQLLNTTKIDVSNEDPQTIVSKIIAITK